MENADEASCLRTGSDLTGVLSLLERAFPEPKLWASPMVNETRVVTKKGRRNIRRQSQKKAHHISLYSLWPLLLCESEVFTKKKWLWTEGEVSSCSCCPCLRADPAPQLFKGLHTLCIEPSSKLGKKKEEGEAKAQFRSHLILE